MTDFPDSFVAVGLIIKPHGIRGEVAVDVHCDDPFVFKKGRFLKVKSPSSAFEVLKIEGARFHKKRVLIKFQHIDNRNEAEKLRGLELYIEKSELKPSSENEFYYYELLESDVFDDEGKHVGVVTSIVEGTGSNLLEVNTSRGKFLLPFVKDYVVEVRRENHEIVIKNFFDLMDINRR